jgi:cyclohexa-1,5-dienecarbonyl-CoA hydratase
MDALSTPLSVGAGVRLEVLEGGALWALVLDTPKANLLDGAKLRALTAAFEGTARAPELRAILLEGAGAHFSFGASVEEHLPGRVEGMLATFRGLFRAMLDSGVPTLAAVRGQCLGGALELASFCTRVSVAPDARLGQPEIKLGVIAPVASVFLAERVGRARAEELCLTGRTLEAAEALRIGLADEVAEDPRGASLSWARAALLPLSAASLRSAQRALRAGLAERFERELARVERLYLDELMASADAREGLAAFLEKRQPRWRHA